MRTSIALKCICRISGRSSKGAAHEYTFCRTGDMYSLLICRKDIQIVPILVGAISKDLEDSYGAILAPYLARDDTFFVISSDFCHWYAIQGSLYACLS